MLARLRERSEAESGFTLIELLVVMIIIAILMAVAVPTFLAQKNTAQKTKATANIKQVVNAIESCASNNTDGTYTNCLLPAQLQAYEKGLVSLPLVAGTAPALNGYAVAAIGTQGYVVSAQIKDGTIPVYFAERHQDDGTLLKNCGGSNAATMTTQNKTALAGSRTCTTGNW